MLMTYPGGPHQAPSEGRYANSGAGPSLVPIAIGHDDFMAVVDPDTAFWSLVPKEELAEALTGGDLIDAYRAHADDFAAEMKTLRFELKPSAVYFNPTERCNLSCTYCYIPESMRADGDHMPKARLLEALERLKAHFSTTMPEGRKPQVIFHGAEPLMNREALFAGINAYRDDFGFGVQTNATLLDDEALDFFISRGISIGLSLDGPTAEITARTRKTRSGEGVQAAVLAAMDKLRDYDAWSVICTMTAGNLQELIPLVELFHAKRVPTCMLNVVRCTLPGARAAKAGDRETAEAFLKALDRTHELYRETGRKMVVANFANVLLSILAPTARRLMCDISPCGGGRAFFALATDGGLFPCSEFIGLPEFNGGNLFEDDIADVLESPAFRKVTKRSVDAIEPCRRCAIRHFCGSPCPAEAHEMNGGMDKTGAFCGFNEEQTRYAFRLIADGRADDFLWDGWDDGVETTFDLTANQPRSTF